MDDPEDDGYYLKDDLEGDDYCKDDYADVTIILMRMVAVGMTLKITITKISCMAQFHA